MATLELTLLGRPQIKVDNHAVELKSGNAQALFYFLATTRQTHSRTRLAGLLWADLAEARARANLRVELARLPQWLKSHLTISRASLAFSPNSNCTIDVAQFEANLNHPAPTLDQLSTAVALYRGDFLEDFSAPDAPLFEEWQLTQRTRLHEMVLQALGNLVAHHIAQQQYAQGIQHARRLLGLEPWREEGHRQLMLLLALRGQRGAALAQYDACCDALNAEFGVGPSPETVQLYDRIEAGELGPSAEDDERVPPQRERPGAQMTPPFQAPRQPHHFVERPAIVTTVRACLQRNHGPTICALAGMGGLGKTTLATHIAHATREDYPDGVLWAYAATSEPLDILAGWAQAYGYDFSGLSDIENRAAAVRGLLADKKALIVLDDVRSIARIRPLLPASVGCATLLTTRDQDIAAALNAQIYPLAELAPQDSYQLLVNVLGAARIAAERDAATAICQLLQHLPLAVEIAAQRLVARPRRRLADMAARLRHVQARLDLGISDHAVRTSFMVSWEALDGELQRLFALLGIFEGRSFTADALAHIAGVDAYTAEDQLFALAAISLVKEEDADRYRQHALLADFACEQLGEGDRQRDAQLGLASYYHSFAAQHRADYAALQPEWANLNAGIRLAHALGEGQLVLDYAEALSEAWFVQARHTEARQAYPLVREAAMRLEDEEALTACLLRWAEACIEQSDYVEAEALLTESRQIFQVIGDEVGVADVKYNLARILLEQSKYDESASLAADSQHIKEQRGDSIGVASCLLLQARNFAQRGVDEQAAHLGQQALVLQKDIDDRQGSIPTLRLLSWLATRQEAYSLAKVYCEQALAISKALQNRGETAATLYRLSVIYRRQEDFVQAKDCAEKSLSLFQHIGDRKFQGLALYSLSIIHEDLQDYPLALSIGLRSLTLLKDVRDNFDLVLVLLHLGDLYYHLNQLGKAQEVWQEAIDIADAQNHPSHTKLKQRLSTIEFA